MSKQKSITESMKYQAMFSILLRISTKKCCDSNVKRHCFFLKKKSKNRSLQATMCVRYLKQNASICSESLRCSSIK